MIIEVDGPVVPDAIRHQATEHGWVRLRGLPIHDRTSAVRVVRALIGDPVVEREGFAPRAWYGDGVYSSTQWPPDQPLCPHNELSYRTEVPRLLVFACVLPPSSGGITTVADTMAVLADLPRDLVSRLARTGWRLTRGYSEEIGIRWQDAFGTTDPADVDAYCEAHDITATWTGEGGLRTSQTRPAVIRHPVTGQPCWFNQIAFLNEHTMDPEVRDYLVSQVGREGLPFTTSFGDGTALDRETVNLINGVYEKHAVGHPWEHGDVLVVDNVLTAHGREPYSGDREIVVGMGDPVRVSGS